DIGNNSISAFNIETDWKYTFINTKWRPTIGLKLDWSSGDRAVNDGKINSFNPLFVNPATYSLAAINTPVNLFSLHPSLILFPNRNLFVNIEYAFFYRSSSVDGFYSPPRIQTRMADGISEKSLGNVFGLFMKYTFSKYCAIDVRSSYFTAGSFIEQSGPSAPIFQIAPTLTFIL
ncbi:MAG: alginate export family protein, partial [Bacteroidota bacterium]